MTTHVDTVNTGSITSSPSRIATCMHNRAHRCHYYRSSVSTSTMIASWCSTSCRRHWFNTDLFYSVQTLSTEIFGKPTGRSEWESSKCAARKLTKLRRKTLKIWSNMSWFSRTNCLDWISYRSHLPPKLTALADPLAIVGIRLLRLIYWNTPIDVCLLLSNAIY